MPDGPEGAEAEVGAFDALYLAFSTALHGSVEGSRDPPMAGVHVGRYQLMEEIGRGGMGAVYRARRADGAFEQVVALKLLRQDLATEALHAQLRNERQLLAHVDHPNIARLMDGGRAPDGRPFLVMEYVEGTPIDRYCQEKRLGTDERLDLFLTVCAAVQHVHGHLVVHQDLKPRNILVTAEGRPMLLDFGIARLSELDADAEGPSLAPHRFATPGYAAPEQLRGERPTTATDVFQLGVLLGELMSGRRTEAADAAPGRLAPDLDAIVSKAAAPEVGQRYPSVADLAEDVRRSLTGHPVRARSGSPAYRAGKFVRRHWVGLGAAAALTLGALGFSISVLVQSARVARERDRAEQVTSMLTDLFAGADPLYGNDDLPLGEFVDRAARRVEAGEVSDPALRAELLSVLGSLYYHLTRPDDADRVWSRALAADRAAHGPSTLKSAELQVSMSALRVDQGRPAEADSLVREALATLREADVGESELMGRALAQEGYVRQITGSLDSAAALYRRALPLLESTTVDATRTAAVANLNMGFLAQGRGDVEAARARFGEALRLRGTAFGPESPSNAVVWESLAVVFQRMGQLDSADLASARALEISRASLPTPNRVIASNLHVRARVRASLGELPEADSLYAEALAMTEDLYGPGAPATAGITNNYAVFLERGGDVVRASELYARSVAAYRAGFGEDHTYTAIVEGNLARVLAASGEVAAAEDAFRHALEILGTTEFDPGLAARPSREFGELLLRQGDHQGADTLLANAVELWAATRPPDDDDILEAQGLRGVALMRLERFEEAEVILRQALDGATEQYGAEDEIARAAAERLADLYDAWGRSGGAR